MTEGTEVAEKAPGRTYEVAYLVSSHIPEDKLAELVGQLKSMLEKRGAFVLSDEFPKFRQLAYTLVKPLGGKNEKHTSAYFGWVKFEANAAAAQDIKDDFARETSLIRFLIVKVDREPKYPSRPPLWRKEAKRETARTEPKAPTMTEAEIDKTIEELLVK